MQQPAEKGAGGVEKGQEQREYRHDEGNDGVELEHAHDGHGGEQYLKYRGGFEWLKSCVSYVLQ